MKKIWRFLIGLHPLVLALVAVGALCFSGATFVRAFFVPGESGGLEHAGTIYRPERVDTDGDGVPDSAPPETEALPEGAADDGVPEAAETLIPELINAPDEFKDGMFSMLLVGSQDDFNMDTIMVLRMDVAAGEVNVLSIPRDTKVNAVRDTPKINGAYGWGRRKDDPDSGMKAMRRELASVIGFFPKRYVYVDMKAFEKLVDAIGGVQFDVPYDMSNNKIEDITISLKKGPKLLNGNEALQLIRYRDDARRADLGRMEVQQDFLMAAARQTLVPQNITKIPELVQIAQEHLKTDLSVGEMGWLANQLLALKEKNEDFLQFYTLPMKSAGKFVILDSEKTLELVNEKINPFKQEITADNVIHVTK